MVYVQCQSNLYTNRESAHKRGFFAVVHEAASESDLRDVGLTFWVMMLVEKERGEKRNLEGIN